MKKLCAYIIFLIIAESCKEKFVASLQSPATGYLVVEGFINSGQSPTTIKLTRTAKLYDSVSIVYEHNATINVLGESKNEIFPLYENGTGEYISSAPLNLSNNEKYRLQIKTQDNKEYLSDLATFKNTPGIDSITSTRENGGLKIYINTHDAQNNTRYYRWDYEETWEIHSRYLTSLEYSRDPVTYQIVEVVPRQPAPDTSLYKCWQATISTNINLGTSEKLNSDVIYLPLVFIEPASEKLSVLYSIKVKQYALSHEAYLFFQKIKKNTEQLGSIFDAQPSELQSNIHCITDPAEIVVGYVDISEEKVERIFISRADVPGWGYRADCSEVVIKNYPDSIYGEDYIPTDVVTRGIGNRIETFHASSRLCVDCTTRGTNMRPSFWP